LYSLVCLPTFLFSIKHSQYLPKSPANVILDWRLVCVCVCVCVYWFCFILF
jgi:hypothetical protein